ncbi:hypothetical protein AUEXF2481DRAFT_36027 [Aureobasidium subglaciale EXF-2481]|uniref:Uncharacterized protein n=1 Tax=Aureobasidium subglaciale (strain EXF-2481) TaxID=1043005 RepID=A0A074YX15_AURSE|nr:uncharacterized protein AUEXF2481DRAFT_36027 [Aureobasidium subglaciale EXF-2481]KEQ98712.1 hypothetical protein AUEXF2481DRAFT_36027 [Aureobasidium subglaciale EXF-2481]
MQYSGQYRSHPYGEINRVVQVDSAAELNGMQGWQGAGWTSLGPVRITTLKYVRVL